MNRRTVGLIGSAVAAVVVYGLLWFATAHGWDRLARLDAAALSAAHDFGADRPAWVMSWAVFCTVLGPMAFRLAALIAVVAAVRRRSPRVAVFLLATVVFNGVLIEGAKWLADRPRPATALVPAWSTAFPSGHAVGVLLAVLALLTVFWPKIDRRAGWTLAAVVVVFAIGAGRVVLNVHHPSDVLAGWALGYAWFVGCYLGCLRPTWPDRPAPAEPVTGGARTPAGPDSAP
ncbi:phosphatase PAP2 family protein [Mycolicibacterium thermoresistibile]